MVKNGFDDNTQVFILGVVAESYLSAKQVKR